MFTPTQEMIDAAAEVLARQVVYEAVEVIVTEYERELLKDFEVYESGELSEDPARITEPSQIFMCDNLGKLGVVSENGQQSTVSKPALPLSCSHIATTIEPLKPSREMTMSTADTYVRARIDTSTKERAADALEAMGLSISDAIRLLMLRIADERRMPFDVKAPNATTRKAIAELEAGKGKRFASVDDLMADLHADPTSGSMP